MLWQYFYSLSQDRIDEITLLPLSVYHSDYLEADTPLHPSRNVMKRLK